MRYDIEFVTMCNKGRVRRNNQDNFWCDGVFLPCENDGYDGMISGNILSTATPKFAVFDGMGGEQCGEIAAHIAAREFDLISYSKGCTNDPMQFFRELCMKMNNEVCKYARNNKIGNMGTTAAIVLFAKKRIFVCNVGDSKVFLFADGKLEQVSYDHVMTDISNNSPLTQYLGIPESEFLIEPYVAHGNYEDDNSYLICSDGLTNNVVHDTITSILAADKPLSDRANDLMTAALDNGGTDNITLILCRTKKRSVFLSHEHRKQ